MKKTLLALFVLVASATAADAQVLTANSSSVTMGALDFLKVSGTVSLVAGQSLSEVKVERGTIAGGIFTAANPAVEEVLHPAVANNAATYSHTFLNAGLTVGQTYESKVSAKVTSPDPVTGMPMNVTVEPQHESYVH